MTDMNQAERANKVILQDRLYRMVDINTDLGQSRDWAAFQQEGSPQRELLKYVSSVNIPCGVHDGHPIQLLEAIRLAKLFSCSIGAHIGFPDPAHQGYDGMSLSDEELSAWIWVQLGTLKALLKSEGLDFDHVRPHGAMYARLLEDEAFGLSLAKAIHAFDPWLILVGPMGPVLKGIEATTELRTAPEVYLGKRYKANGTLHLQRFHEGLSYKATQDQAMQVMQQRKLTSLDGQSVAISFKTLHLSPMQDQVHEVAKRLVQGLGQAVPLSMVAVGANQWIHHFDDRNDEVALTYGRE